MRQHLLALIILSIIKETIMTSTTMYCTYLTTYSGNKLPPFYIGSSSYNRIILKNYHGSVCSKKYGHTWKEELKNNPQLFKTKIITTHLDRQDATKQEALFHISLNVVKSLMYINESIATENGFFGRDVSGKNNPMYGSNRTGEVHLGGVNISNSLKEYYKTDKSDAQKRSTQKRMKENNPSNNVDTINKMKEIWKNNERGIGVKNGMYGKVGKLRGKKLYNDGKQTSAFLENQQPEGWIKGRHKKIK